MPPKAPHSQKSLEAQLSQEAVSPHQNDQGQVLTQAIRQIVAWVLSIFFIVSVPTGADALTTLNFDRMQEFPVEKLVDRSLTAKQMHDVIEYIKISLDNQTAQIPPHLMADLNGLEENTTRMQQLPESEFLREVIAILNDNEDMHFRASTNFGQVSTGGYSLFFTTGVDLDPIYVDDKLTLQINKISKQFISAENQALLEGSRIVQINGDSVEDYIKSLRPFPVHSRQVEADTWTNTRYIATRPLNVFPAKPRENLVLSLSKGDQSYEVELDWHLVAQHPAFSNQGPFLDPSQLLPQPDSNFEIAEELEIPEFGPGKTYILREKSGETSVLARIDDFSESRIINNQTLTTQDYVQRIRALVTEYHADCFYLDLRNNPGGILENSNRLVNAFGGHRKNTLEFQVPATPAMVSLARYLLINASPEDLAYWQSVNQKALDEYLVPDSKNTFAMPTSSRLVQGQNALDSNKVKLRILVNEFTASAAEITAARLQAETGAVVIGSKLTGGGGGFYKSKNTIKTPIVPIDIVFTEGEAFISGKSIKIGVRSDVTLDSTHYDHFWYELSRMLPEIRAQEQARSTP